MERVEFSSIKNKFPSSRQEPDGCITFDCPICAESGHIGKRATLYANGAISCVRFASVGGTANHEHCGPIREMLGLSNKPTSTFIEEALLDGKLTFNCSLTSRGKVKLIARNCDSTLHCDEINIYRAEHRDKFLTKLELNDEQRKESNQTLIRLIDRLDKVKAVLDDDEEANGEPLSFKALADGRIVEQIAKGFAVYDPVTREVSYCQNIEFDDVTYQPINSAFIDDGGLSLPTELSEYYDESKLDSDIETYLYRYLDLNPRDLKLAAYYAKLSYLYDKVLEIPYLRPIGPRGNGKSRFVMTVGGICYRPVIVISPTAASLFRIVDRYHPTLVIDEANFQQNSDDTAALMQILNAGYQRIGKIPRMEKNQSGELEPVLFDPFGCKIIASLKTTESQAFESRCIQIAMSVTTRTDIKWRLTPQIQQEQAVLRGKLTLWRLRNWGRNFEDLLDQAEDELKRHKIEPRYVQVSTPLYAMISDSKLKNEFIEVLKGRDAADANERQESFDGELTTAIHTLLFSNSDERLVVNNAEGISLAEDDKVCELLPLPKVVEIVNQDIPEKKKHDEKWIGKQLRKLGLQTGIVQRRASSFYKKRAIIYDRIVLSRLFKLFSLEMPTDFDVRNVRSDITTNQYNSLECEQEKSDTYSQNFDVRTLNSCKESKLQDCEHCEQEKLIEPAENSSFEVETTKLVSNKLVALDTETERFNPKFGINERTAQMIGLSLSYDGEQAYYETNPNAWPLLMPESEQTAIFHNAKFDFGVFDRANLPRPQHWEDTFIASSLLDENIEHGLKPLAKNLLGIEQPMSFEEADKMRLLDPEVFSEYACNDARYTFQVWQKLEPEIDKQNLRQVYELEKTLVPIVMDMENKGILLDVQMLSVLGEMVNQEIKETKQQIYDYAGCTFDINSPQKTAIILYDKLGLSCKNTTSEGHRSVSKEILEEIRGYHPIVDSLLHYREIDKLANTFIKVLPTFADKYGRIHPSFQSLGAKTGRFSCTNPNVQQIPARSELGKKLRSAFIAGEGRKLVVADYSQMELRVLAHYSQDPLLLNAYTAEQETDLHTLTASNMFRKAQTEISKQERAIAKMINFGIAYGITPIGLFNRLRPSGIDVSQEDCKKFIDNYFRTYTGVNKFLAEVAKVIHKRGYVKNFYGRRRRLKGQNSRETRQAQNFIIQATAADIVKDAMVRLHKALPKGANIIGQVHDELIIECNDCQVAEVQPLIVEIMQTVPKGFTVPMLVESKVGNNWGECK